MLSQKVRFEGHSRVIAVTKYLPEDWKLVTIKVVANTKKRVTICFDKVS